MPGISRNRISYENGKQNYHHAFICKLCDGIFDKPVVTACCRQTYCKDCIEKWLTEHKTCPNDYRPLASDGLSEAPTLVATVCRAIVIKCIHHSQGCKATYFPADDDSHLQVCEVANRKDNGLSNTIPGHHCVSHLMKEKLKLTEDYEKLKKEVENINKANEALVVSELKTKEEYEKFRSKMTEKLMKMTLKNEELQKEIEAYKSVTLPNAIMNAKGKSGSVDDNHNLDVIWEKVVTDVCMDAIVHFDNTKHVYQDFVNRVKVQLDHWPTESYLSWSVFICLGDMQSDHGCVADSFIRVSFDNHCSYRLSWSTLACSLIIVAWIQIQ